MDQSCSKNTFESLGIVMEDGKPKFRLNEPVLSAVNVPLSSSNFDCDDDETSFVVLGKSSLDFINNASLIDYKQIQEKSLAVDYNSIISTLNHEEIEWKVAELLQENVKLKETLAQNNRAMKTQFNKLVSWQEELMKVHGNHKQKFAETRNMITLLQQENADLKTKLACTDPMAGSRFSGVMIGESIHVQDDGVKNSTLTSMPTASMNLSEPNPVENNERKDVDTSNVNVRELLELTERQDRDSKYHEEVILSLKAQLHAFIQNSFKPIETPIVNVADRPNDKNRQKFLENFMHYNEKLSTVVKCYAAQTARFTGVQDCLKSCVNVLQSIDINSSSEVKEEARKTLEDCRKQLIDEQIQNITERQNLIIAQNQFQKIFSDYNSALHELEILREETGKPIEKIDQLEREREELMKNMERIELEKTQLDFAKEKLIAEQTVFEQQQAGLEEAKASLNSQSLLYETEMKNLQDNMKVMQKQHDDMLELCRKSKAELTQKDIELESIRERLNIAKDDTETIIILRQQLEVYQTDFEEEQRAKHRLIAEREDLTDQLRKLRNHNQNLLHRINGPNPAPISEEGSDEYQVNAFCISCGLYKMPGQWHGPGFCQPVD